LPSVIIDIPITEFFDVLNGVKKLVKKQKKRIQITICPPGIMQFRLSQAVVVHLHKPKPVIASAAKQSIFACLSCTFGSPRRCAPRDDGLVQPFFDGFQSNISSSHDLLRWR
jgi:hypothetical protein